MHTLVSGIEYMFRGGFMMYPLLLSALIALTVILERFYFLGTVYKTPRETMREIFSLSEKHDFARAIEACRKLDTPVSSVLTSGLEHIDNPAEEMELSMKNRAEEWIPQLEKRIEVLDTVITAAPLMGLLGTITGMMASFQVLSEKGVNEPNAITGGVAEALIATATGLVIALLCLVAYNYLSSKIKVYIYEVESAASRLMEIRMSVERKRK
jgi:biopolymer transport protein ExbB